MSTSTNQDTVQQLADEYSKIIRDWFVPNEPDAAAQASEAREVSAQDQCEPRSPHSAMAQAFQLVMNRQPDPHSESDAALWRAAWERAKQAGFPRKMELIQSARGMPVYAFAIKEQWIDNPRYSECGQFSVDPIRHYGLTAEETSALESANERLRVEGAPASGVRRNGAGSSAPVNETVRSAIADVVRAYPVAEELRLGGRFAFLVPCHGGSHLLITECDDETTPSVDALEVACGRCAANGETVEEAIVPIRGLGKWIDAALLRASEPTNVADYFVVALGVAHGNDKLGHVPIDSQRGQDCVEAIDDAVAFVEHIRAVFGSSAVSSKPGQSHRNAALERSAIDIVRHVIDAHLRK